MSESPYQSAPLHWRDGIPFFSLPNDYTDNYERISADHLAHTLATGHNPFIPEAVWDLMERSTASLVDRYAKAGDRILDVGVGMGRLLSRFPQLRRYGMDISAAYLAHARARGIEVCYGLIEDMPYCHDFFDVITCTDVLEHVLDLNLACARILSVLRPGGRLIVRVPYREELKQYCSQDLPYQYVHLRNFDEYSLELHFTRVFRCRIIDEARVWHTSGRLRFQSRWRINGLRLRMLRLVERTGLPFVRKIIERELHPIEINLVVEKPE